MIVDGYALERVADETEIQWFHAALGIPGRVCLPSGDAVFGIKVDWTNGEYRFVNKAHEIPDPPPERQVISKAEVMDRLTDAQLDAALNNMTNRQKERWRMPGHPNIYKDDPELLLLLAAIGADPAVVLA